MAWECRSALTCVIAQINVVITIGSRSTLIVPILIAILILPGADLMASHETDSFPQQLHNHVFLWQFFYNCVILQF